MARKFNPATDCTICGEKTGPAVPTRGGCIEDTLLVRYCSQSCRHYAIRDWWKNNCPNAKIAFLGDSLVVVFAQQFS